MGFREYNPGLNRFLTRDMFNGALSDLDLGTDPWNANRYMFGGGNPISRIELNGHMNAIEDTGGGMTPRPTPPPVEPEVPDTKPIQPSTGEKIAGWFAPGQFEKNVTNELVVKPIQETYEACKAAVMTGAGSAGWQQCQIGIGLTALSFTGAGKVVGIGVRSLEGLAAARAETAMAGALLGRTGSLTVIGEGFSASEKAVAHQFWASGRNVVLREAPGTVRTSDLLVDGVQYDVYTPEAGTSIKNILSHTASKWTQVRGGGVVVDLSNTGLKEADFGNALARVNGFVKSWGGTPLSDVQFYGGG